MTTHFLLTLLVSGSFLLPAVAQNRDDAAIRKNDPKHRTVTYRQGAKVKTLYVRDLFPAPKGALRQAPGPEHKLNDRKLESGIRQRERLRRRTGGSLK